MRMRAGDGEVGGHPPWIARVAGWCVGHRYGVVVACALLTLAAAVFTVSAFRIDSDLDDLIDRDAPFRQRQLELLEAFPQAGDRLVVVVRGGTLDDRLAAADTLALAFRGRADLVADVFAPAVDPFFQRHALLFESLDEMDGALAEIARAQPLLSRLASDPRPSVLVGSVADALSEFAATEPERATVDAVRERLTPVLRAAAAGTPVAIGWLELVADGADADRPLVLDILPEVDRSRIAPTAELFRFARTQAAAVEAALPAVNVALTGTVALRAEELETVGIGATRVGVLALVLVTALLALGLGSLRAVLAVVMTLLAGLVLTAAFALATIGTFTMISIAFAVLFIGLGVDFAIHVVLRAREEVRDAREWRAAVVRGTARAGAALMLCAPTTAVAFFAFSPTGYVGLAELGLIAGVGMILSLILSLTLLPALLAILVPPCPLQRLRAPAVPRWVQGVAALAVVAAAVPALMTLGALPFDADPLALRARDAPSVAAFRRLLEDPELTPYTAELLLPAGPAGDALERRVQAVPGVGQTVDVASFVPADQGRKLALLEDAKLFLDIPEPTAPATLDATALRAELARLAEAAGPGPLHGASLALARRLVLHPDELEALAARWFKHWPAALERLRLSLQAGPTDVATLPEALVARYVASDGRRRLTILPAEPLRTAAERRDFVAALQAVAPGVAGDVVQITGAAALVVDAMRQATIVAVVGVSLLLGLILRRLHDVAVVLATVLLAALLTLGAMSAIGLAFNFANVVVLPLLFGFGVDAAIHVVMRWRDAAHADGGRPNSTPRAVVLSAATTIASFGTLMLSPHRGTASMGLLLTIAIIASLAAALVVLPVWLRVRQAARSARARRSVCDGGSPKSVR